MILTSGGRRHIDVYVLKAGIFCYTTAFTKPPCTMRQAQLAYVFSLTYLDRDKQLNT